MGQDTLACEVPWGKDLGKMNRAKGKAKVLSNLHDDLFSCMPISHCKPQKIVPYNVISMAQPTPQQWKEKPHIFTKALPLMKEKPEQKDLGRKHCFMYANCLWTNMCGKAIFQFAPP